MAQEWRVIERTPTSVRKRLYVNGQPTNRYSVDAVAVIQGGSPGTVDKQVGTDADDGCKRSDGVFQTVMVRIGKATGKTYDSFLRWPDVTYEGNVDTSYILCHHYQAFGTEPLMTIYGVDESDPLAPTNATEFDADPLTTASVPWNVLFSGTWNQSPSCNDWLQELLDSYGPYQNQAIMAQVRDNGSANGAYNNPYDYNLDPTKAAKLHIEYSVGGPEWKQLQYTSEPPTPNAWNQIKQEAGEGYVKILFEGE